MNFKTASIISFIDKIRNKIAINKKGEQKADGKNDSAGEPISPRVAHRLDFLAVPAKPSAFMERFGK